jgi:hypothetical protein
MPDSKKPTYRLLTGVDDHAFCLRASETLDDGYVLYGSLSCTYDPEQRRMLVAQAIIRPTSY